jgi:CheY-like chemotaxis protein
VVRIGTVAMSRILVVDDEAGVRSLVCTILGSRGFLTEEASDGVEALEKLRSSAYDAMVLDLMMPRLTGQDVVNALSESDPDMLGRTVIATAYIESARQRHLDRTCKVVAKPFDFLTLVAAVESCARRA